MQLLCATISFVPSIDSILLHQGDAAHFASDQVQEYEHHLIKAASALGQRRSRLLRFPAQAA